HSQNGPGAKNGATGPYKIRRTRLPLRHGPGHGRLPRRRNRAVRVVGAACALLFNGSTPMTKQISPLRQRMIDDMAFRNMSPNTQKVYAYAVANFARFHRQSPDKLGLEHVRDYRLHLMSRGLKASSINPIVGALRFFYGTTLGNKQLAEQIPFG